jgi:beta-RFAP synthase
MKGATRVHTPCRLHFGMFGFDRTVGPQWGGVGVMVEPPAVEIMIEPAARLTVEGALAERTERFVRQATESWRIRAPECRIVVRSPPEHSGLGVGTQLGLSIAAGLRRYLELPELSTAELAASVGRGQRSAVGTHGFRLGGLIVDGGQDDVHRLGTLFERVSVPEAWRFVLIAPHSDQGLAGSDEAEAFLRLPPVPGEVTQELWRLTEEELLPALKQHDCVGFGEALYHFGRFAGECFTEVQGGPFASAEIGRLVDALREHGVPGVGQSSWGPTVFALTCHQAAASGVAEWLIREMKLAPDQLTIARPNNTGAIVT